MASIALKLGFDPSASLPENWIKGESAELKEGIITLQYGAFYRKDLKIELYDLTPAASLILTEQDYELVDYQQKKASTSGEEAFAVILIKNTHGKTHYKVDYRACGGMDEPINVEKLKAVWELLKINKGSIDWSRVLAVPKEYFPAAHLTDADTVYGFEYVVNGLKRIKDAIENSNDHRQVNFDIFQKLMEDSLTYYNNYNRIYAEEKSKIDKDIALSEKTIEDVKDIYDQILNNEFYLNSSSIFEALRYKVKKLYMDSIDALYMSTYCSLLGLRDKKGLPVDDPSLDIYNKIGDLQVYYRADRADGLITVDTDVLLKDYGPNAVAAIAKTTSAPGLVDSVYSNQKVLETGAGKKFTFLDRKPTITNTSSVVLVLSTGSGQTNFINQTILKNNVFELKIDTQNEKALTLSRISTGEKLVDIKCSRYISDSRMIVAFSLNDYRQLSYALSSHPKEGLDENNGLTATPSVTDSIEFDQMLVGSNESAGGLLSLAIFNKTLSKRHLEALSFYWTILSDVSVNFIGNGYFSDREYDCTSDYLKVDAFNATEQILFDNEPLVEYFKSETDLGDTVASQEFSGKPYMVSKGSTRKNKVVLRKQTKVDIGQTYCLFFDVAFSKINPPILHLKINGEDVLERFTRKTDSLSKNCAIEFRLADTEEVTIEWFNDQLEITGNMFAITNIRLLAKPNVAITVF